MGRDKFSSRGQKWMLHCSQDLSPNLWELGGGCLGPGDEEAISSIDLGRRELRERQTERQTETGIVRQRDTQKAEFILRERSRSYTLEPGHGGVSSIGNETR